MSVYSPLVGIHGLFQYLEEKTFQEDLIFFLAVVVAGSLIFNLAAFLTGINAVPESSISGLQLIGNVSLGLAIGMVQGLIGGVVLLLGISLVEHFFLLFVDVQKNFETTMKSVIYALMPGILFYWLVIVVRIPFVSLLLLFCFGLITYFGIRIFHEKSKDRAVFVSIATSAVLLVLFSGWLVRNGLLW